jgi:DNA-binding transcriptional LysR family regulator
VVVFIHGLGGLEETTPRYHLPWLRHLALEGSAVLYPRYETDPPRRTLMSTLPVGSRRVSPTSGNAICRSSPSATRVFDRPPTSAEISRLPLLGCYCPSFAAVEAHLRAGGGDPDVVFRSDDNATLLALVEPGVGAALMPRLTFDPAQPGIRAVEFEGEVPARTIVLGWNSERALSPAASTFVEAAKRVCARWNAPFGGCPSADAQEPRRRSSADPERSVLHAKVEDQPSNDQPL